MGSRRGPGFVVTEEVVTTTKTRRVLSLTARRATVLATLLALTGVAAGVGGTLGWQAYTTARHKREDAREACRRVRELVPTYGYDTPSFPFSEVAWLNQLVDATELAGGTLEELDRRGDPDSPEGKLAFAAEQLRTSTIGGGLNHPTFMEDLVGVLHVCEDILNSPWAPNPYRGLKVPWP
jgi:hypothetical protein